MSAPESRPGGPGRQRPVPPTGIDDLPEHRCEVLIVGGGPSGLLLAGLLAQRGVDVVVLERRRAPSVHPRAIGLHPPAVSALGALGVEGTALAEGAAITGGQARSRDRLLGSLTFERAWPQRPYVLALPQNRTETLLAERLAQLAPTALRRGHEVTGLESGGGSVTVSTREVVEAGAADARHRELGRPSGHRAEAASSSAGTVPGRCRWRARLVVGADGSRSTIRELAGIGTRLTTYPDTYLMGDFADRAGEVGVRRGNLATRPRDLGARTRNLGDRSAGRLARIHLEPGGVVEEFPLPGGRRRWVAHTSTAPSARTPEQLAAIVRRRTGERIDPGTNTMISAFGVRRRTAERMVDDRVVLIGDAAHEVSPIGGQGMTLGWLDALALAPLLEDAVHQELRRPLHQLPRFRRFERTQLHIARGAGRLAQVNMALGRPLPAPAAVLRDAALRTVLSTPLRHQLARAYTMAWA